MNYTPARYEAMVNETFETITKLAKLKGGEYSGDVDRLANFRRNGEALGVPMELIWAVYANKHHDAVMQYIKDLQTNTKRERMEGIAGRVDDLIVYLLLFKAMVEERDAASVPRTDNGDGWVKHVVGSFVPEFKSDAYVDVKFADGDKLLKVNPHMLNWLKTGSDAIVAWRHHA